jgi:hypothetical protein
MLDFLGALSRNNVALLRTRHCTSGVSLQLNEFWALLASDIVEVCERFYGDDIRCLRGRIDLLRSPCLEIAACRRVCLAATPFGCKTELVF